MYKKLRAGHRWIGLIATLFLFIIAVTGFLLATKGSLPWVRPPEAKGAEITAVEEVIGLSAVVSIAIAVGNPEIASFDAIGRIDYRPSRNVFKVLSKNLRHEIQVCGKTGKVLQVAYRSDQLVEDIHDLSFFAAWLHTYWLPVVAALLAVLAISGTCIFFVPVLRKRAHARKRDA